MVAVIVAVEPVEVKPVETVKAVTDNLLEDLNLLVVLVAQVYLAHDTLVVTETQEDNNTLKPWTAEEVVPATSVVKVVLLMLEVVPVDLDIVKATAVTN